MNFFEDYLHFPREMYDEVQIEALAAAKNALSPMENKDATWKDQMKAIMKAFVAVTEVEKGSARLLEIRNPGKKYHTPTLDDYHIVATAIGTIGDSSSDIHPYSVVGQHIVAFAAALRAMAAYSDLTSVMLDGEHSGSYDSEKILNKYLSNDDEE